MKNIFKTILIFAGIVLLLNACKDYDKLTAPKIDTGTANFSKFVTIGNSLTAGYQSSSLFESAQKYSFGKLIADAIGTQFEQPIVSDPGTAGRLEVKSIEPFELYTNPNQGIPTNFYYPKPYNNLGVPGALLYDVLNATNANNSASAIFGGVPNPMFDLILRNQFLQDSLGISGTQFQQAALLQPTMVTLWIGNNDILGHATAGGTIPFTDVNTFNALYTATGNAIASLGANVVVGNIPNVSAIPFFTTVGPQLAFGLPWNLGIPGLVYQQHTETGIGTGIADSVALLTGGVLVTLKGSSYAPLVGTPNGKFYRDFGFPALPPGVDTTKLFGLDPQNPWPNALILDPDEIGNIQTVTASYNSTIADVASQNNFGLVDFFSFFNQIRMNDFTGGTVFNGITLKTFYVTGGLFSLDGVHPTSQGYAIVANQFIKEFNNKFGAKIPEIDVSAIPGSITLMGKIRFDEHGYAIFPKGAFDHLFF